MNDAPLLEARKVDAFYGASHVLRGVDFHVGRGETVSLLGRNGMGKTTLLRTLMGLVPAKGGEIRFGGASVTTWDRNRIALAFPNTVSLPAGGGCTACVGTGLSCPSACFSGGASMGAPHTGAVFFPAVVAFSVLKKCVEARLFAEHR